MIVVTDHADSELFWGLIPLEWLGLARRARFTPWKSYSVSHQFQMRRFYLSLTYRSADAMVQCHLAALSVTPWHVLKPSPQQVAIYETT